MRHGGALLAATVLAFFAARAMPGDPVRLALAAWNVPQTPEAVASLSEQWGLDRSLLEQYARWLWRLVQGDWGQSFRTGQPILAEFLDRAPWSLAIGLGGLSLGAIVALALGFASARRPGGWADTTSRALAILTQSLPGFAAALLLLWLFAIQLGWLRPFTGTTAERLVLPVLVVGIFSAAPLARVLRRELRQALAAPWVRAARARGIAERRILFVHAGRPALAGFVAALAPEAAWVIGGTAVAEVVFAVPGVSLFLVQAMSARDHLVLQAYIVFVAAWMILVSALAHAVRARLDPRGA